MTRQLPTQNLRDCEKNKPRAWHVAGALDALLKAVPAQWREPMQRLGLGQMGKEGPEWLTAHDALLAIEEFDENYGQAARWNMSDDEIRAMAKRLAAEADDRRAAPGLHGPWPARKRRLVQPGQPRFGALPAQASHPYPRGSPPRCGQPSLGPRPWWGKPWIAGRQVFGLEHASRSLVFQRMPSDLRLDPWGMHAASVGDAVGDAWGIRL